MDPKAAAPANALRRIQYLMLSAAAAGTGIAAYLGGSGAALGFLIGAGASYFNFRWLKRTVDALGPDGRKPGRVSAFFLGARYLLLGTVIYVIVRYFEVSLLAALTGLLVAVAAVVIEILYELIYAGT